MKNTKENLAETELSLVHMIPTYRYQTMEMHSAIVKAVGEQSHTIQEGKFYWTLSIADCECVDVVIILDEEKGKPVLEIFEVEKEAISYKRVDYDVIYILLGYAHAHKIEMTYN